MSETDLLLKYPTVDDLISLAHQRLPKFVMDYLEHGAAREHLLQRNKSAFDNITITPRYLRNMTELDTSTTLFDRQYAQPFGIAPVGMGGMIWPNAEQFLAAAAKRANIAMVLSTVACASIEQMAEQTDGQLWYQLYSPADEKVRWNLMERASNAGIEVLVVTVDAPGRARRERPLRSGFSMAPRITPRLLYQAALNPGWSCGVIKTGFPRFANFSPYLPNSSSLQQQVDYVGKQLARQVVPAELQEIRRRWSGKLVVKGILHSDDAAMAVESGADGIWVSNHGGRQTDAAPVTLEALSGMREAVGKDTRLLIDSGVRSGLDVFRALTAGADFVFLGRAFFYGIAALGEPGAKHVVDILRDELTQSMRQMGTADVATILAGQATKPC